MEKNFLSINYIEFYDAHYEMVLRFVYTRALFTIIII